MVVQHNNTILLKLKLLDTTGILKTQNPLHHLPAL